MSKSKICVLSTIWSTDFFQNVIYTFKVHSKPSCIIWKRSDEYILRNSENKCYRVLKSKICGWSTIRSTDGFENLIYTLRDQAKPSCENWEKSHAYFLRNRENKLTCQYQRFPSYRLSSQLISFQNVICPFRDKV